MTKNNEAVMHVFCVNQDDGDDTDNIAIDIINSELGIDMYLDGIQRSHRLGPKSPNGIQEQQKRNQWLTAYRKRYEIFHSKRKLKGKNLSSSESLTKHRYKLLNVATEK